MKKIIPFSKDIRFNTKIYDITSISLEHTLSIDENNQIDGEFILSGEYKINESSLNTEPFIQGLPFNISLDEYYDTDSLKIDIDDFKYEIINEEIIRVNIDVLLEGSIKINEEPKEEIISPDVIIEARKEIDNNEIDLKEDIMKEEDLFQEKNDTTLEVNKESEVTSIFDNYDSKDDNYISYYVHIVRDNENIDMISKMYSVNINDIKEYNNIDKITLGDKIIIPSTNNETI